MRRGAQEFRPAQPGDEERRQGRRREAEHDRARLLPHGEIGSDAEREEQWRPGQERPSGRAQRHKPRPDEPHLVSLRPIA